ncbi:hypothetical protein BDK51DRAFT_22223 [Blyttiomyces helicus]|uniref:Uncharacterized protein n=1 Tax=Blyttiomyces helicus TaxID=388810 RepID=A0A4V1IQA7_9FUNG|nr:hypothetical protein BDK51DRAFT_22223 [Blyttiomyces helicus]|eukprot:RKO85897.1 hypothetical protein BDK51DRAFT_22223 [Blyttiomyces helicus]
MTAWFQKTVSLTAKRRGCHLKLTPSPAQIPELREFKIGLAHFLLQHTSASLAHSCLLFLGPHVDPDVRVDMEMMLNRIAPENAPYTHTMEGSDDMPAHVKSSLMGVSINVPITNGKLALGTWQGIWLGEHRDRGGSRTYVTLFFSCLRQEGAGELNVRRY